jgi:L-threonylcarbamoyladenylate synthase
VNLPSKLVNEDGSIAIRIVRDDFCIELIKQVKKPIVSTSANISGEPYPKNFEQISLEIKNGVDYIVQHRQNDYEIKSPSSIIKLNNEGEIEILR